jgi:hypothetical protein
MPAAGPSTMAGVKGSLLFEGIRYPHGETPWYYLPKWIFISTPPHFLAGILIFCLLGYRIFKNSSKLILGVVLFSAVFPIIFVLAKRLEIKLEFGLVKI